MHAAGGFEQLRHMGCRLAVALTAGSVALYAAIDFIAPGNINIAILYASSVVVSGRSRSRTCVWLTAAACVVLTWAGALLGPQPQASELTASYINRSLVVVSLLIISLIVHQRVNASERLEEAHDTQIRQNQLLCEADEKLRQMNSQLEHRVQIEVARCRQTEQALHQAQKMESIGHLTGGVAHDFNNILTTVIGSLDMIESRSAADDPRRRLAQNALLAAEQGASLIEHLLSFARRQRLEPMVVEIEPLPRQMLELARPVVGESVDLSAAIDADLWRCCVDRAQLQSALFNLVINARDAMPRGGRIVISAQNEVGRFDEGGLPPAEYVRLSVADTGSGMPPEVLAQAFEPFFTTKEVGKGSGLGLSMVYGFAKQSGGTVRIDTVLNRGTTVHLYLPRTTALAISEAVPPVPSVALDRPATVLIAEDEDLVRQMAAEALAAAGYRVLVASDASSAMQHLKHQTIDLLVSDVVMPGSMTGLDLAGEARRLQKGIQVLLTTGYSDVVNQAVAEEQGLELLWKPFRPRQLAAKVDGLLRGPTDQQLA